MSVYDQTIVLHLRGSITGRDPFNNPIYGPDEDVPVAGWWESAGSSEDINRAEQVERSFWVYSEDSRLTAADQLTIPTAAGDVRCNVAPPQPFPAGELVDAHIRVLATRVEG